MFGFLQTPRNDIEGCLGLWNATKVHPLSTTLHTLALHSNRFQAFLGLRILGLAEQSVDERGQGTRSCLKTMI